MMMMMMMTMTMTMTMMMMRNVQVVPGQAGGGSFQKNKPIGNGHVAG